MALPFTDSFTNSNGTELTAHNASYAYIHKTTAPEPRYYINSNACYFDDKNKVTTSFGVWTGDTFNDNQYAQGTIAAITSGKYIGVVVRGYASSGRNGYTLIVDNDETFLEKYIEDATTQLGDTGAGASATDVVLLEASGTTITPYVGGAEQDPPGAQTDSSLSSGDAGLAAWCNGASTSSRIDDLECGNLAAESSSVSPSVMLIRSNQIPIHQLQL